MTIKKLAYNLLVFGMSATVTHARLGENTNECEKRYGKPIFKNADGELSYATYKFEGKKIAVFFVKDKSTIEIITTGPTQIYSKEQVTEIGVKSLKFLRGLLGKAYGFTEEQLQSLANIKQKNREIFQSQSENESTLVVYTIESNQDQTAIKTNATLIDTEKVKGSKELGLDKFMADSETLELKGEEAKESGGF